MRTTVEDDTLTIYLEGDIDTNNASALEAEALDAIKAHSGASVVVDAGDVTSITADGLRMLVRLQRQAGDTITLVNVPPEVLPSFMITGFTQMMHVYPRIREISVEGCDQIGSGGFSHVYRIDADTIAKIYSESYSLDTVIQERETAQKAFLAGVPTAISYDVVRCGDCYGIVFELVEAKTLGELLSEDNSRLEELGHQSTRSSSRTSTPSSWPRATCRTARRT